MKYKSILEWTNDDTYPVFTTRVPFQSKTGGVYVRELEFESTVPALQVALFYKTSRGADAVSAFRFSSIREHEPFKSALRTGLSELHAQADHVLPLLLKDLKKYDHTQLDKCKSFLITSAQTTIEGTLVNWRT